MSAPTKGSGMTWVGRVDPTARGSGVGGGAGPFHRRSAGGALGSLRAKPGRVGAHRAHRCAARCQCDHRCRSCGRQADQADAAQVQLRAGRRSRSWPTDVVRFVGEAVAAVVAPSKEEAEDIADLVEIEIAPLDRRDRCAPRACRRRAASCIPKRRRTSSSKDGSRRRISTRRRRRRIRGSNSRRARAGRTPRRWRRAAGHAAYDAATGRVTLTCTTQMPHLMRTAIADLLGMPESDLRVIAPDVGGGFGQKMSLTAGIRDPGVAGAPVAQLGGLDRGPAGKSDRRAFTAATRSSRSKARSTRTPS